MAKKRIHLTESQLYGLVEQAINELDWRTYMNAANKRAAQAVQTGGRVGADLANRELELTRAAENAFMRKHKLPKPVEKVLFAANPTSRPDGDRGGYMFGIKDPSGIDHYYDEDSEPPYGVPHSDPNSEYRKELDDYFSGESYYNTYDDKKREYGEKPGWVQTGEDDFFESVSRRVTESVMRKLRRGGGYISKLNEDKHWLTDPQNVVFDGVEEMETFVRENLDYDKCIMLEFNKSIRFSVDNGVRVWVDNVYGERYWQSITEMTSWDYYEEIEDRSKDGKYVLTNYEWHHGI